MSKAPLSDVAASLDARVLAALHAASFDDAWSELFVGALLVQPGVIALVTPEQTPVGFILLRVIAGEAEILTLAVTPAERGRGQGRALLSAALDVMTAQNVTRCFLEVAENNTAARALYDGAGFVICGRREKYYAQRIDALVMERRLQPGSILAP